MVCITFVGIHQVVVVTVLATQMDPLMMGTTNESLAMLFMLAWSTSSKLSPVNPINLLVSNLVLKIRENPELLKEAAKHEQRALSVGQTAITCGYRLACMCYFKETSSEP